MVFRKTYKFPNYVAGFVVRRGKLVLAISTSVPGPALSVRLRQRIVREFGLHYAPFLDWMQVLREPMAAHCPSVSERRTPWYEIVDSDVLTLLQNGLSEAAYGRIDAIVGLQVASAIPESNSEKLATR